MLNVIEFHNVSKSFHRHAGKMLLRNHLTQFFRRVKEERFFALKHVSFTLQRGESLAVIGRNGAGKSTLLGLVAGLSKPDEGTMAVNGQVAALLELGSGFHPDLTGRENVRLNAALLGLSRKKSSPGMRLRDRVRRGPGAPWHGARRGCDPWSRCWRVRGR